MKSFFEKLTESLDDDSKKKVKKFGIGFGIVFLLIIIIAIVVGIINRKTSYEKMEQIMEEAAYKYFENNKESLPNEEVKTAVVSAQTLVEKEYMKPIEKYTKDSSCSGNVVVTYKNGDYDYQAFLECKNFKTRLLIEAIKEDNKIVTQDAGLYDETGMLRFRGEYLNNYIKLGGNTYRIVKIDNEDKIYVTLNNPNEGEAENLYFEWDDRYNSEEDAIQGINDYSLSRINTSLQSYYKSLNDEIKNNTTTFTICDGKRAETSGENGVECNHISSETNIALMPLYDYMKASIAPGCTTPLSRECANYNYLKNENLNWWTATGSTADTTNVYYVDYNGAIEKDKAYGRKFARYLLAIKSNAVLADGNGSSSNPYVLR